MGRIQKKSDDSSSLGQDSILPIIFSLEIKAPKILVTPVITSQFRPFFSLYLHKHRGVHKQKQTL